MNISIYLEQPLAKQVQKYAKKMSSTRNAVIREALRAWLQKNDTPLWPKTVQNFQGVADFTPFEKGRVDLLPPNEDPLS